MGRKTLRVLVWRLHRFVRSRSWPAVLALALLAFEAPFYSYAVAPALDERAKLRAQVVTAPRTIIAPSEPFPVDTDPRVDLVKFYAALARPSDAPDLLRRLHRNAEDQGLLLRQAEYHPARDPEGKLMRYQILLPAKGTYPELRRFLAKASRELPGLAIDSVNFQRQHIGDAVVEAQINLTLFLSTPL